MRGRARILEELYSGVCESNPPIQRMNYVNAELTKLSVNTFVTTKISYANMLAQICETLPGGGRGRGDGGAGLRYADRREVSEGRARVLAARVFRAITWRCPPWPATTAFRRCWRKRPTA